MIADIAWPMLLAPIDEDVGLDHGEVGEIVDRLGDLGIASVRGATLAFDGHLAQDDFREVLAQLLGAVPAALLAGATGNLTVVDAGTLRGGEVVLHANRFAPRDLTGRTPAATSKPKRAEPQKPTPAKRKVAKPKPKAKAKPTRKR